MSDDDTWRRRLIYKSWTWQSYLWQGGGVLWLLWGSGLTVWTFTTHDSSKLTGLMIAVLVLVLIVPSAGMFFGAWWVRHWVRERQALLPEGPRDYPMNVLGDSPDKTSR